MDRLSIALESNPVGLLLVAALAVQAIHFLAQGGEGPVRAEPAQELLFDGDLTDTSGAKRVGTAHGGVTFADGRHGKCASFDGRSWIDTGFSQEKLGDEFTVECWMNPGKQQSLHADIFGNHVGEGLGCVLQQDGANTNQFMAAYGAGGGRWVMTDTVLLAAGRWQHVALVKTREDLRIYLNGILVATVQDTAPARPSPMPVAVGLGYSDRKRCFRGLIDDFRIWNKALTDFGHAGIDPAAARETRARYLHDTLRPAAGALAEPWTLATDDTRLSLGVSAAGEMVVSELCCPVTSWNWTARPVAFGFLSEAEVAGRRKTLEWRFVDAAVDERDGRKLTLRFACDEPALEIDSQWHARPGSGPVHHSMWVRNRSTQTVAIGEQPTFDLDLTGADARWCFHSDGGTADPVGVYRHPLTAEQAGCRYTVRTAPTGQFIPYVVFDANQKHGVYVGLEWSFCQIQTVTLAGGASPTVRMRGGSRAVHRAELAPGEPDSDQADWPSGMRKAADYAHEKGLRFGLYWTDNLDMASPAARAQRAARIRRLFEEYRADMWRSDCTRGAVIGNSYAATRGFYALVDDLAAGIPGFRWENCSGGGRIKDYGAMRRAVKIFNSDRYSPLIVRQAFYDSSYAFHPIQLEGHVGSINGRYRPRGAVGIRYAFRSTSMGAPEWFLDAPNGGNGSEPWTQQEKDALKACVDTYKTRIRPLVREADLYHILPRPDGRNWDGIEYCDPAKGKGVVYLFKPSDETTTETIRFKGLNRERMYRVSFEDDAQPASVKSAAELMDKGLPVTLRGEDVSELVFFELAR